MGFFLFRINGLAHKFGIKGHEFPLKRKFQTLVDKHIKLNLSAESPRGKVFLLVTVKLLKPLLIVIGSIYSVLTSLLILMGY